MARRLCTNLFEEKRGKMGPHKIKTSPFTVCLIELARTRRSDFIRSSMRFAAQAHCDSRSRLLQTEPVHLLLFVFAVFTRIAKNTVVLAALFCQSPHTTIARARPAFLSRCVRTPAAAIPARR